MPHLSSPTNRLHSTNRPATVIRLYYVFEARQAKIVLNPDGLVESTDGLETPRLWQTCPLVSAFVAAMNDAIRAHQPSCGMSAMQRTWLAFCVTAVWITNSIRWARFARASLGPLRWLLCRGCSGTAKFPGTNYLWPVCASFYGTMASPRGASSLMTPITRAPIGQATRPLHKVRDKENPGYRWGQSLVFLVLVTPKISLPVGFVFYQPAPEFSAWYQQAKVLKKQGNPPKQRPPKPAPNAQYPTKQQLALRLLAAFKAQHPTSGWTVLRRMPSMAQGPLSMRPRPSSVACKSSPKSAAIKTFGPGHVNSTWPTSSHPSLHAQTIRIRGVRRWWYGSAARVYTSVPTKQSGSSRRSNRRGGDYRYLIASDLSWRTLDIVQGHSLRWLVEVFIQDWKSYEGWSQLTKQPGEKGARQSVNPSLLLITVSSSSDQQHQLKNNLPAYTVGSLLAHVQVECLV